ncbi:MAG: uridine diphosphate-N-acetylglucosamine-binding protein YvcK [Armatimonadetes bacterium]|nr:uridine diphosphate-N-acetylglucosamine-binding protein YvcK [Armatimonadota bacterium]
MISRYRIRRILAPTTGIRWAILSAFFGFVIFLVGFAVSFRAVLGPIINDITTRWTQGVEASFGQDQVEKITHVFAGACLIFGFYLAFQGTRKLLRRLVETLNPDLKSGMANTFVRRQQLAQGPKIVALGGGTGLSTLLRGLKQYSTNITAVVTVTDDGGSSGRLASELGIIPPGDLRACLVALADSEKVLADLFQHRFGREAGSLSGHSLGNLLIAGLVQRADGDYDRALGMASEVLNIRGRVVPSTLDKVGLRAVLDDDSEISGETKIVASGRRIRRLYVEPEDCTPYADAIRAIEEADLITIGPGSVFTSVIPNLLIPGIAEAIERSEAMKVFICNVMTQPGESDSFTAAEHLVALQANIPHRVVDYVVVNNGLPSSSTIEKYRGSNQFVVDPDVDRLRAMGFKVVLGNFVNELDYVRHDPFKVAGRLSDMINKRRR